MENIVLHLKLNRGVRGTLLAYVVCHHIKVAHISPQYDAYLNLDEEMIKSHHCWCKVKPQDESESLDRAYFSYQCDTFKINKALVYQFLSKVFMNTDRYVYMKQRKSIQDGQAVFFDVHKCFLGPDHVARQATEAERKLQRVGMGHVCCTPKRTACCHGEPYRLWLQLNGQWHQSLPIHPKHKEH